MNRIYRFIFLRRQEDDHFLLFFRVFAAVFALVHFLSIREDFNRIYGREGLVPADLAGLFKVNFIPSLADLTTLLQQLFTITEPAALLLFRGMYIMSAILLAAGLFSRVAAIVLFLLHAVLVNGASLYCYGVDVFTTITLFYCCVFPVGYSASLDNHLFRKGQPVRVNPSPWRKLLQLHLCIVYFFSGFEKLLGFNWWNGESIWKAVHLPLFYSSFGLDYSPMAAWPVIPIAMGWCTIIAEMLYPVFIWQPRFRTWWLMIVISMHLGIMVTLNLYFFSTMMIFLNLSAFLYLKDNGKQVITTVISNRRERIILTAMLAHCCLILIVSSWSAIKGYDRLYNSSNKDYKAMAASVYLHKLLTLPGIAHYTRLAGIDAGYGFFSPNVASVYLIYFTPRDSANRPSETIIIPPFSNAESVIRYASLLTVFQKKLIITEQEREEKKIYLRYLDAIAKSIGRKLLATHKDSSMQRMDITLYVYEYPSLKKYLTEQRTPLLIALDSFQVRRPEKKNDG